MPTIVVEKYLVVAEPSVWGHDKNSQTHITAKLYRMPWEGTKGSAIYLDEGNMVGLQLPRRHDTGSIKRFYSGSETGQPKVIVADLSAEDLMSKTEAFSKIMSHKKATSKVDKFLFSRITLPAGLLKRQDMIGSYFGAWTIYDPTQPGRYIPPGESIYRQARAMRSFAGMKVKTTVALPAKPYIDFNAVMPLGVMYHIKTYIGKPPYDAEVSTSISSRVLRYMGSLAGDSIWYAIGVKPISDERIRARKPISTISQKGLDTKKLGVGDEVSRKVPLFAIQAKTAREAVIKGQKKLQKLKNNPATAFRASSLHKYWHFNDYQVVSKQALRGYSGN